MLLDSNIIIYAVKPDYFQVREFVKRHDVMVSTISQIEALGYHALGEREASKLERLFDLFAVHPITESVVQRSIVVRRRRKGMKTVDAIIAATALETESSLATHDTNDFDWINELDVIDPLSGE